jgi:hypothetical protein
MFALLLATTTALSQIDLGQMHSGLPSAHQRLLDPNLPDPQDVGKNLIVGQLKSIEGMRLRIVRPDGEEQLVVVDAGTLCFRNYGDAATLADFKVGDPVGAIGEFDRGTFTAHKLFTVPSSSSPPADHPVQWSGI